jgi:hypothetical protein
MEFKQIIDILDDKAIKAGTTILWVFYHIQSATQCTVYNQKFRTQPDKTFKIP